MSRGRRFVIGFAAATAMWVLGGASASAAGPYYASPTGAGDCSSGNPCSVNTAVALAVAGETVLLAPGTYELTSQLDLYGSLMPQVNGTRPELHSSAGYSLIPRSATSLVRDLRVNVSGLGSAEVALNFQAAGTALRVEAFASGPASPSAAVFRDGGTIADSVLWASGPAGATAVNPAGTGGTLRNVTAVATGMNSEGLFTSASYMSAPGTMTVTIQNSVVRGDLRSFDFMGDATHTINVNVDHGNYSTSNLVGPFATLNDPGGPQTTPGMFANPAMGNFHELTGSATIDAGAAVAGLSATDLDGESRTQGGAPDIGADEFVPPPAGGGPSGTTPSPTLIAKKKCKKHKKRAAAAKRCKKKHR
jgi:hypothetical protein